MKYIGVFRCGDEKTQIYLAENDYKPFEWSIIGCGCGCGWLEERVAKMGKPQELEVELLSKVETRFVMVKEEKTNRSYQTVDAKETLMDKPCAIRFGRVKWTYAGCSSNSSLCNGLLRFTCSEWSIIPFKEEVDSPHVVGG